MQNSLLFSEQQTGKWQQTHILLNRNKNDVKEYRCHIDEFLRELIDLHN